MQILLVLGALLIICVAMSTSEQRAAARLKMKPIARMLIIPAAVLWTILLEPWRWFR